MSAQKDLVAKRADTGGCDVLANRTSTERAIALLWAEALQRDTEIGPDANFFEAGGDSLAMMMVLFRVKEELGVELPPATLMESSSLREFCELIDANLQGGP